MWDLPRPGLEPVSPALAGRFSTAAPPGKPGKSLFYKSEEMPSFLFVWHAELHVKLHDKNYVSIWDLNSPTFDAAASLNIFLGSIYIKKGCNILKYKIYNYYCIRKISAFQSNNGSFFFSLH